MDKKEIIDQMFKVGAHFGYSKRRRHASVKPYIFGVKNQVEIFDLEKTSLLLEEAMTFVAELGRTGKTILFVGNKPEIKDIVKLAAEKIGAPYVAERWIGCTLTNSSEIRKRVNRMVHLKSEKAKGGLDVYTKKERGQLDKEIVDLERFFGGIVDMVEAPKAFFIVDSREEKIAADEARKAKVPLISLSSSDCDIRGIDYPIVGNDASRASVKFFVDKIINAYEDGKKNKPVVDEAEKKEAPRLTRREEVVRV